MSLELLLEVPIKELTQVRPAKQAIKKELFDLIYSMTATLKELLFFKKLVQIYKHYILKVSKKIPEA